MFEVRRGAHGSGLVAVAPIARGTILFGADEWHDGAERASYFDVSEEEYASMAPAQQNVFVCFAYNVARHRIRGTLRPEATRHPSNFINHSCAPNAWYDGEDHIVARFDIAAGEPIAMDYGTYSFSFDHLFRCRCGARCCRGRVARDDWRRLVFQYGFAFPTFMHDEIAALLQKNAPHIR